MAKNRKKIRANKNEAGWLAEEVAEFLASQCSAKELLEYHPSSRARQRLVVLLSKSKSGTLGANEQWELDQFEHLELLTQAIKAKVRPARPVSKRIVPAQTS